MDKQMKILSENFSNLSSLKTQIKSYYRNISSSSSIDSTTDAGDGPIQCVDSNLQLLVKQMKRYIKATRASLDKLNRCPNQSSDLSLLLQKYNQLLDDLDTFLQSINNNKPINSIATEASNQPLIRPLSPKVIIKSKSRVKHETYLSTLTSSESESEPESFSESTENSPIQVDPNSSISSSNESLIYHNDIHVKQQSNQSTLDLSYQMPFESFQGDSMVHQLIRLTQILVINKRFLFLTVGLLMAVLLFIQLQEL